MGEGCGPFREKQACRFSVNILFVCLFVCLVGMEEWRVVLNRVYCHTQHGIDRMSGGGVALANHRFGEDENRMRERKE